MESHQDFVNGIMAAPQDISLPIFQDLLRKGYTDTRWRTDVGASDVPCIVQDGEVMPLRQFVSGLAHNAPIYEKTHVGCKCAVIVTGKGKPDVVVTAFGIKK